MRVWDMQFLDRELQILRTNIIQSDRFIEMSKINTETALYIIAKYRDMWNKYGYIYSSVSHTNLFIKGNEWLIITDIDSIRSDNIISFWIQLLFLVFFFERDMHKRYILYAYIWKYFMKYIQPNNEEFKISVLYHTIRPFIDPKRLMVNNQEFILKMRFMKDILLFQKNITQ